MNRRIMVLLCCLTAGGAGLATAQSNITLIADADGSIQENNASVASSYNMVRSYSDGTSVGRQNFCYIRFNLNVLAEAPETNGVLRLSLDPVKLQTFGSHDIHIYGLLDTAGNTPQQWDEAITYNSTGLEIPGDDNELTQDIDTNRVVYIGDLPATSALPYDGETFSVSNAALNAFIGDRYEADGYMTLIFMQEFNANRETYFYNRDATASSNAPSLLLTGILGDGKDTTPPVIASISPLDEATDVDVTGDITAQFNEPMNASSINDSTFVLYDSEDNVVSATITYDSGAMTATLNPSDWLAGESSYRAVVTVGVTDISTNALAEEYTWSFTTGVAEGYDTSEPISLEADADTWLSNDERSDAEVTNGNDDTLQLRWHAVRDRLVYVRFDITGIPEEVFESATLAGSFSFPNGESKFKSGTWNVYGVDDDQNNNWTESSVRYSTAAGVVNTASNNTFAITNAALLGTIFFDGTINTNTVDGTTNSAVAATTFTSVVTNMSLNAFLLEDTDGLVTFILIDSTQTGNEWYVDSKEGSSANGHGPMTLNFDAIVSPPEATTINYITTADTTITIGWDAITGHTYIVERSSNLRSSSGWTALDEGATTNRYVDTTATNSAAFYRVVDEGIQ